MEIERITYEIKERTDVGYLGRGQFIELPQKYVELTFIPKQTNPGRKEDTK